MLNASALLPFRYSTACCCRQSCTTTLRSTSTIALSAARRTLLAWACTCKWSFFGVASCCYALSHATAKLLSVASRSCLGQASRVLTAKISTITGKWLGTAKNAANSATVRNAVERSTAAF